VEQFANESLHEEKSWNVEDIEASHGGSREAGWLTGTRGRRGAFLRAIVLDERCRDAGHGTGEENQEKDEEDLRHAESFLRTPARSSRYGATEVFPRIATL
jgi:hypothetical protein